jgi:hypothetical protein
VKNGVACCRPQQQPPDQELAPGASMHCVAAVHGPLAPAVHCTALAASADGTCWSGAADGSITWWGVVCLVRAAAVPATCPLLTTDFVGLSVSMCSWRRHSADAAVQPVAVLQGHSHPVVALLSGLTGVLLLLLYQQTTLVQARRLLAH